MTTSEPHNPEGSHPASDVKAHWRDIVAEAKSRGEVVVTNHGRPDVVVIPIDRYAQLKEDASANDPLMRLRGEFDRELALLHEPGAGAKLREAFASSGGRAAKAANAAASRRRR